MAQRRPPRQTHSSQARRPRQPRRKPPPRLTVPLILAWADAFYSRHGFWPKRCSGRVAGQGAENWYRIDTALRLGLRGLPGKSSLTQELRRYSGVARPWLRGGPPLTIEMILAWADDFRRSYGFWPNPVSGRVAGQGAETWQRVSRAIMKGLRGLPGGSTLSRELQRHRQVFFGKDRLAEDQIFCWAQSHFRRTGKWPQVADGPIPESSGANWDNINRALIHGFRGLPGGTCLKKLLVDRQVIGPESLALRSVLTPDQIWEWAQTFHEGHGNWPVVTSGPIDGTKDDTWSKVGSSLSTGNRGLPGGSSLARFLASRGVLGRRRSNLAPITAQQILAWADAYFEEHGDWPYNDSGTIRGSDGLTWQKIDASLKVGRRGLPGGSTLSAFLSEHRTVENGNSRRRYRTSKARLSLDQIRAWAEEHRKRTGQWPHTNAGRIHSQDGLTWQVVDTALRSGCRGLAGGSSLSRLFGRKRDSRTAPAGRE